MTPHINALKEDIAPIVLMPGDPLRAKYIADNFLEDAKLVNTVRGMSAYTGTFKGVRVSVFASGMGIPSIGIYSYELYKFYDVEKIIRIGTSGSFNKNVKLRDIILSEASYSISSFPLLLGGDDINFIYSSLELNTEIIKMSEVLNIPIKYGHTVTSDVFDLYAFDPKKFRSNFNGDFLSVEMEAFGLFYVAKKLNKKAACLMTVVDSLYDKGSLTAQEREKNLNDMIILALNSII